MQRRASENMNLSCSKVKDRITLMVVDYYEEGPDKISKSCKEMKTLTVGLRMAEGQ